MVSNHNFDKRRCWACEYYACKRNFNSGIAWDSVKSDEVGTCGNKRSTNFNKNVNHNDWCTKFQRWTTIDLEIAKKEKEKYINTNDTSNSSDTSYNSDTIRKNSNLKSIKVDSDKEDVSKLSKFINFLKTPIGIATLIYIGLSFISFMSIFIFTNMKLNEYESLIDDYVSNGGSYHDQYVQDLFDARVPYVLLEYSIPVIFILLTIAFVISIIIIKKKTKKKED